MDFGLSDEFRAARRPKIVVAPDVTHAKVQKNAQDVLIARRRSHHFRLVVGRAAATVDGEPNVPEPQKRWLALAQHRRAEDVAIECDGALYVSNDEGIRHHKLQFSTLIRSGYHEHPLFERSRSVRSMLLINQLNVKPRIREPQRCYRGDHR